MCGILYTTNPGVTPALFQEALDLMRHRGPDAPGCYSRHGSTQLGHCRLSIVDLNPRSNQPFYCRNKRHVIIFNGEIYNYQELAKRFGIELHTRSDTELLLELYLSQGARMLDHLLGMFAFIILDTHTGESFVARDRLGVKPLYVYQDKDGVTFSSEMSALLHLVPKVTVDDFALRQYRKMRGFFNGRTLYKEVQMFPAAHYSKNGKSSRYWDLPSETQLPPSDEELEALIQSAVDYRCIADVPVGSYLSGGLDSTIVAALSNVTHTWVVGMRENNEFEWARLAAEKMSKKHHEILVTPEEFLETARWMIKQRKEPLAVPNEVLLFLMTKAVKKENTVVLSGEGADELFAGYDRIFRWSFANPTWDLKAFADHYAYGSLDDKDVVEDAVAPFLSRGSTFAVVSAFFQISHLHGLLRRLDNSTMLCSVEGRVPFVDHRLVERLAGVSLSYKMQDGEVKAPLKRIFGKLLPGGIVSRPKVGFPVDLGKLMPPEIPGRTPTDKWFNFCLETLKIQ